MRELGAAQLRLAASSELFHEQKLSRIGKEVQRMLEEPWASDACKTSAHWKELEDTCSPASC